MGPENRADSAKEVERDAVIVPMTIAKEENPKNRNTASSMESGHPEVVFKKFRARSTLGQLAGARVSDLLRFACCMLAAVVAVSLLLVAVFRRFLTLFRSPVGEARGRGW